MYFLRRKSKNSRFYALLSFLTLLPVVFEPINKMWHTGDYMAFPMRYGYMTTLMMLTFAAVKLSHTKPDDYAQKNKKRYLIGITAAGVIYFGLRYGTTVATDTNWIHMFRHCGEARSRSFCF